MNLWSISEHNPSNRRSRHGNNNINNRAPQQNRVPTEEATRRADDGAVGGYDEEDSINKKKLSTAEFREKLKTMGSS